MHTCMHACTHTHTQTDTHQLLTAHLSLIQWRDNSKDKDIICVGCYYHGSVILTLKVIVNSWQYSSFSFFFFQRGDTDPEMVMGGKCQRADQFSDMAHSSEHTHRDQSNPFAYRSASPTDLTKCPHCVTLAHY